MAKKTSRTVKSVKKPAPSKGKNGKAKATSSKPTKSKPSPSKSSGGKNSHVKKVIKRIKSKPLAKSQASKPVRIKISVKKNNHGSVVKQAVKHSVKHTPVQTKSIKTVGLSKLGKAKIKPKVREFIPRKIEKIIDISKLESKLQEIMKLDHTEFSVE